MCNFNDEAIQEREEQIKKEAQKEAYLKVYNSRARNINTFIEDELDKLSGSDDWRDED